MDNNAGNIPTEEQRITRKKFSCRRLRHSEFMKLMSHVEATYRGDYATNAARVMWVIRMSSVAFDGRDMPTETTPLGRVLTESAYDDAIVECSESDITELANFCMSRLNIAQTKN